MSQVNFTEFKGLASYFASNRSSQKHAYFGKNCFFDQGKIKASKGHSPFLPVIAGSTNYQNLTKYEHTTGGVTTEHLMTLYNKQWRSIDTEAASRSDVGSPQSTDELTDARQYINTLYAVSPTVGGVKITDPTTIAAVSSIPKGSMIEFGWEKMWVTGVVGTEATLHGSRSATAAAPLNVEDFTTNAQIELVGKGGKNTALRFLVDTLYIFKKDNIHFIKPEVVNGSSTLYLPKPFSLTGGAVNQESTVVVENDIWFLTPENQIRTLGKERDYLSAARAREMTEQIRNIKDSLALDQSAVAKAHYHNNIYTIALAEKGSTVANIVITYNFTNKSFGIDRFPSVTGWASVNNKVFMATTGSGQIYQDRFGFSFGDDFEIPFEVRMPFVDYQEPNKNYRHRSIYVRGVRSKGVPITVRLYRGNYETFSDYVIPEPTAAELNETAVTAPLGQKQFGAAPFGGSTTKPADEPAVFTFEKHISTSQVSNMFAVGLLVELKGQRFELEQLIQGILPGTTQKYNI